MGGGSRRTSARRHAHHALGHGSHTSGTSGTSTEGAGEGQSFIALLPALFTTGGGSGHHQSASSGSSSDEDLISDRRDRERERERTARLMTAAAEAKAKEAGFTLALPSTMPRHGFSSSSPTASGSGSGASGLEPPRRIDLLTGSASSSRAGTPSPQPLPAATASANPFFSRRDLSASESSLSSVSAGSYTSEDSEDDETSTLRRHLPNSYPSSAATPTQASIGQATGVSPPHLLIDPLEGSDVRTTRSFSGGAPPPYRGLGLGSRGSSTRGNEE